MSTDHLASPTLASLVRRIARRALAGSAVIAMTAGRVMAQEPTTDATSIADRLRILEERVKQADAERELMRQQLDQRIPAADKRPKWYDRLSIRGYGQVRYTTLFGEDNDPDLVVANDRSVSENETLMLRRGRVILSGNVTDRLFVYAQADFAGSTGAADQALQMRDFYGDIALDDDREYRFRVGTSKVPFGWVNMQSSQNRAPIERPDALNSAVEGERDMGAYFFWAPKHIRELFADLVRSGRKGSGDYGVFGIGAFNGQGLNRGDRNGEPHWVARLSYPFAFDNDQVLELGAYGYSGRYVVTTSAIGGTTPISDPDGHIDERAGVTFVLYPQPFGLEAEWTWGSGPQLSDDGTRITTAWLQGGYVMASWRHVSNSGAWQPFVRWNYFDGARKFARNAPRNEVNEIDIGVEWQPRPELELVAQYTHTFRRTNTSSEPFADALGDDRLTLQVQVNF